jgi:hypothetical protein
MRRYRKLRLFSAGAFIICTCLLFTSYSYEFGYLGSCLNIGIGKMTFGASITLPPFAVPTPGWIARRTNPELRWIPHAGSVPMGTSQTSYVNFPLWMPILLSAFGAFFFHRLGKPKRIGHCVKCQYDLTGNSSGICPECGTRT